MAKGKRKKGNSNVMKFGKHRGLPYDKVPTDYMEWLFNTDTYASFPVNLRREVEKRLYQEDIIGRERVDKMFLEEENNYRLFDEEQPPCEGKYKTLPHNRILQFSNGCFHSKAGMVIQVTHWKEIV